METLKGFTLNVQGIPAGQSAVRYDSREREAPLMEAMKTLKGMALFKVEGLSFVLDLEKNDQEWVHIHGVNHASLSDVCSRCAERFAFAIAREIDLTFIPQGELSALDPKEEGDVVATYQGHSIDLFPYLMEPVFWRCRSTRSAVKGVAACAQIAGPTSTSLRVRVPRKGRH